MSTFATLDLEAALAVLQRLKERDPRAVEEAVAEVGGTALSTSSETASAADGTVESGSAAKRMRRDLDPPPAAAAASAAATSGSSDSAGSGAAAPSSTSGKTSSKRSVRGAAASTSATDTATTLPVPPSARGFQMSRYRMRHVALHVAYCGHAYYGFASQEPGGGDVGEGEFEAASKPDSGSGGGSVAAPDQQQRAGRKRPRSGEGEGGSEGGATPTSATAAPPGADLATIESVLFAALVRACLIEDRASAGYTRCGRTDKGVSAGGQVLSIRLRSKAARWTHPSHTDLNSPEARCSTALDDIGAVPQPDASASAPAAASAGGDAAAQAGTKSNFPILWQRGDGLPNTGAPFPPPAAELDYAATLNSLLPSDIRVLGWCDVPEDFSARFSATTRSYRYFFPARDLNLTAMREAGAALVGVHDYRNVCKIDLKHCQNWVREILSVRIVRAGHQDPHTALTCTSAQRDTATSRSGGSSSGGAAVSALQHLAPARAATVAVQDAGVHASAAAAAVADPRSIWYVEVVGRAFLWHQIRCVVALLFLVGRGYETPATVKALLDPAAMPRRPQYAMAQEAPLLLYHCGFGEEGLSLSCEAAKDVEGADAAASVMEEGSTDADSAAAAPDHPVRFRRSYSPLLSSFTASVPSLRRATVELEKEWSQHVIKAALVESLLDRLYATHTTIGEVAAAVNVPVAAVTDAVAAQRGTPAVTDSTVSWGTAVAAFGGAAGLSRGVKPLYTAADSEYMVSGVPHGHPAAAAPGTRGAVYTPLLARATGKAVEERWRELSHAKKADVMAKHPTNAAKLHAHATAQARSVGATAAAAGTSGGAGAVPEPHAAASASK